MHGEEEPLDPEDRELIPLALELVTAATSEDDFDFVRHLHERLAEAALDAERLERLIAILATFGGTVADEWAKDLHVPTAAVLQSIALDIEDPS